MSWPKGKLGRMKERMTPVAQRITDARVDLKMTQREVAALADVDRVQLLKYERGICIPYSKNLTKLAAALQTTPNYLLMGIGPRWIRETVFPWKIGQRNGKLYCPYCHKGQNWSVKELENFGYSLSDVHFCGFCGREVDAS